MQRRRFLESCALVSGSVALGATAWAEAPVRRYASVTLIDIHGAPIKASALAVDTNYVFSYPYVATPCFLLDLGHAVTAPSPLRQQDGSTYAWMGGVGSRRSIVAFSAICAHKLAYPTREVSFIRYQASASATSDAKVIHCCADHSVYDPAVGARVIAGPAPQPLAAILLEHDPATDTIRAVGTQGPEQFDAFFRKYDFKLAMDHGGKARQPVGNVSVVRELTQFCRQTIEC